MHLTLKWEFPGGKAPASIILPVLLAAMLMLASCCGCSERSDGRAVNNGDAPGACRIDKQEWPHRVADGQTHRFEVHFIDVGQGDAILVLTPSGTMLIDAGPRDGGVTAYLHSLGVMGIDIVIATHPHADHIGGMPELFVTFPVGEVIDPGVVHSTLTYARYLELIDSLDIPYTEGRSGMRRDLCDEAFAEILHPSGPDDALLNDASVVVRLVLGNVTVLLTGDIERKSEEELLAEFGSAMTSSNILKVPHHGSVTSSHPAFIEAVNPETSIIMCGLHNSYGNPHRQTLAVLEAAGSDVWRTDLNGHIIIRSDGTGYTVGISRDGPPVPALININTASLEELQYIIYIGPERAGSNHPAEAV
jgi:competence protein ComEC